MRQNKKRQKSKNDKFRKKEKKMFMQKEVFYKTCAVIW